jgi:hypothetical protein
MYFLAVLATFIIVYKLGFKQAAQQIASNPERLRDITFLVWDNYAPSKHGFLVFYTPSDFDNGNAYSNHPTLYLIYMYMLYKVEMLVPILQMRIIGALLNMFSLAGAVFYIIYNLVNKRLNLAQIILCVLSVVFMVSMPAFWLSAARFNVDNPFPLMFSMLTLTSFFIWRDNAIGKRVWISILLLAALYPKFAVLLGVALLLCSFQYNSLNKKFLKLAVAVVFVGCFVYLQPVFVSKILGFHSLNSGWIFRSGLDGATSYFTNIFLSIVSPYYPRPLHIISVPLLLLIAQSVILRFYGRIDRLERHNHGVASLPRNLGLFYFLIFSQYIFYSLFWPQVISIHPYLYDYLLLAPASVIVTLRFLIFSQKDSLSRLWVLVLMFLISFNFQQIAQAKCDACYYPSWEVKQWNLR